MQRTPGHCWRDWNTAQLLGNTVRWLLRKSKPELPHHPAAPLLSADPEERKAEYRTGICTAASQQRHVQALRHGSSLGAHRRTKGEATCGLFTQRDFIAPAEERKFPHGPNMDELEDIVLDKASWS